MNTSVDRTERNAGILALLMASALLIPLIMFAYIGRWNRYVADDMFNLAQSEQMGPIGAVIHQYLHWTGRYSMYGLAHLLLALGVSTNRLLAASLLTCWVGSLFICAYRWLRAPYAAFVATLIPVATLSMCPSIGDSLYWEAGSTTYLPTLIILPLAIAAIAWRRGAPVAVFLLAIINSGFSEMATLGSVAAFAAAALWRKDRRSVSAFVGSLVGAAIMFLSPGNAGREVELPPRATVLHTLPLVVTSVKHFLGGQFSMHIHSYDPCTPFISYNTYGVLVYVTCLISGLWLGLNCSKQRLGLRLAYTGIATIIAISIGFVCAAFFACQWVSSYELPYRAIVQPCAALVVCVLAVGWIIGSAWNAPRKLAQMLALAALCLSMTTATISGRCVHGMIAPFRRFASEWDRREIMLENGKTTVFQIPMVVRQSADIGPYPDFWVNDSFARVYRLPYVKTR